jgi:hypothetical protein
MKKVASHVYGLHCTFQCFSACNKFCIRILKTCPPFLARERSAADVARSREFGCFAKRPSKFLEITKKFSKFRSYSNTLRYFATRPSS